MPTMKWQAPPGWPEPPPGWSPPPGWQPDPSWPKPPAGWQWWQKSRWPRWQKALVWSGGGLGVAVVVLLIAAEAVDAVKGCGSVDPTDPSNYTSANIVNDTRSPITVSDCQGAYCNSDLQPKRLLPGQRVGIEGACGVSGREMTSWKLTRDDGSLLGYIAIDTPRSRTDVVYDASAATRSRSVASQPAEVGVRTR